MKVIKPGAIIVGERQTHDVIAQARWEPRG